MKSTGVKLHLRAVATAAAAMLVSFWALGLIVNRADAQGTPDHSDLAHSHGFTAPGDVADWPPRPTGADPAMTTIDGPESAAASPLRSNQADSSPAASLAADLAEVVGDDWMHISSVEAKSGKDGFTPGEDTYFSRDLNQTVIVLSSPGGQEILTFRPDQLQPVITNVEEIEAADLARAWLSEQGVDGVSSLEGFGIRALDDGELYPVRMVYVTFATSWFDDPSHFALVDLSNGIVIEGGAL